MKYTTIDTRISYRELPPKWNLIYEDNSRYGRLNRYLDDMDRMMDWPESKAPAADDIASLVFTQQSRTKEQKSRHLASLIQERHDLAQKHLDDINFRIEELREQRPFRGTGMAWMPDGSLTDVDKALSNLEHEAREIQTMLWRDLSELRCDCLDERQEYKSVTRRMDFLTGGLHGLP
jgi:hypothetical protein